MNVFWIMLDSLRRDHVGIYGSEICQTPNLDAFGEEAILFDNAYPEGLPTIPVRTAMVTGNRTLGSRPWQPLIDEDVTAAELLSAHGYTSSMITDTYHMAKPGMNFHRGFDSFKFIRGQEGDCWALCPHSENLEDYLHPDISDRKRRVIDNYLRSIENWTSEADTFPAQVFQEAARMVECLQDQDRLFFWVDSFDPHEPWNPPSPYDEMYMDEDYDGPRLIDANYADINYMSEEEQNFIRAMYAGEVTLVDRWFGHFIDTLKETGVIDRSIVIVMADHGHPHGDHGLIMKSPRNMYNELLRLPMMIRLPHEEHAGERIEPLVQTDDLLPTTLDLLGLEEESVAMTGKSAWKLVTGEADSLRDAVVTGYHQSPIRCVRDEKYSLVALPDGNHELYDLQADPGETNNIYDENPEIANRLLNHLGYWSYTKLPPAEFENVQEAYEWAHTSIT